VEEMLIAPCGMNCGVCASYLALKNDVKNQGLKISYCTGCRPRNKKCAFLKKRCRRLMEGQVKYCYECLEFPCEPLHGLTKRYRTLYRMSMIENLAIIRDQGIQALLEREAEKWRCPDCGGVISCHNGLCFSCGVEAIINKKKKYRWGDDE
jgi:hypothetical protein